MIAFLVLPLFSTWTVQDIASSAFQSDPHWSVRERHVLRIADSAPIGIVGSVARCGERLFVLANVRRAIYLSDSRTAPTSVYFDSGVLGRLAPSGAPSDLLGMTVDCATNAVFIVLPTRVVELEAPGGRIRRTYDLPSVFAPTLSEPLLLGGGTTLVLNGLWPKERFGWLNKPDETMFTNTQLGLTLSLGTGETRPVAPPLEPGCRSYVGACLSSTVWPLLPDTWVVSQKVGTEIAILKAGRTVRRISVRSPRFRYAPGDRLVRGATTSRDDVVRWGERNSVIAGAAVIDGRIVVVHQHGIGRPPTTGFPQFRVFANIYTYDGRSVAEDLPLPDLPVGVESDGLWVAVYPRGERTDDATEVTLQRLVLSVPGTKH